jgi:hypothetical protein
MNKGGSDYVAYRAYLAEAAKPTPTFAEDFWKPEGKRVNGWVTIFVRLIVAVLIFAALALIFFGPR